MRESITLIVVDDCDGHRYPRQRILSYQESTTLIVVNDCDEQKKELEIIYEEDTLSFVLNGERVFGGDWTANFKPVFERALELWPSV